MEKYENLGIIGEGSYGLVMKCRHRETGQMVAIKKFLESEDDPVVKKMALREIRTLKRLRHENLVNLLDVFRRKRRFYLVFEFLDHTLLDELEASESGLGERKSREHIFQVVRGIDFCHSQQIIHRDIKPENVLVSTSGIVKLCDFGFARLLSGGEIYTDYVATRWYRAPELLVIDTAYGKEVDIWAIGCLFAEMMSGDPLFPGDSDIDQLYQIIRVMGKLSAKHQYLVSRNPAFKGLRGDHDEGKGLAKIFPDWSLITLDFLGCCLKMDPQLRLNSSELLRHLFFVKERFSETFLAELRHKLLQEYQGNPLLRKCQGSAPKRSEKCSGQRRLSVVDAPPKWRFAQEDSRRTSMEISGLLGSSSKSKHEPMDVSLEEENRLTVISPHIIPRLGILRPSITNVSFANEMTSPWRNVEKFSGKLGRKPDRLDPLIVAGNRQQQVASPPPVWMTKRTANNVWKTSGSFADSQFSLPNVPGATMMSTSPQKGIKKKIMKDGDYFLSPRTFHFQTPSASSGSRFHKN